MSDAPSCLASTRPSELEAQKCVDLPTTADWHGAPPPATVIFARTPSCSKYLSCSATQTAEYAKLPTAVATVTSASSLCCAVIFPGIAKKMARTAVTAGLRIGRVGANTVIISPPILKPPSQFKVNTAIGRRGFKNDDRRALYCACISHFSSC